MFNYIQSKEELGKNLRSKRERRGLTQQEVAEKLYVDRSTYAYYETGKTEPSVGTLIQLSEIFGISVLEILKSR